MLNDAQLAGHPARVNFGTLQVPVLIISAEDDRFGTAPTAKAIARQLPSARLVLFLSGGHVFLGHDNDAALEIASFVRQHQR